MVLLLSESAAGRVTESIQVPLGLCIFVSPTLSHTHIHTKRQTNELFACMCCLHYWTVQRQTQRPPLKGWDSQDNPRYCIPRSLVPQRCRISTHTSGLVLRLGLVASCGSSWLTVTGWQAALMVGYLDGLRQIPITGWHTASSACPRVHMQMCASVCLLSRPSAILTVWLRFQLKADLSLSSLDQILNQNTPQTFLLIQTFNTNMMSQIHTTDLLYTVWFPVCCSYK